MYDAISMLPELNGVAMYVNGRRAVLRMYDANSMVAELHHGLAKRLRTTGYDIHAAYVWLVNENVRLHRLIGVPTEVLTAVAEELACYARLDRALRKT